MMFVGDRNKIEKETTEIKQDRYVTYVERKNARGSVCKVRLLRM